MTNAKQQSTAVQQVTEGPTGNGRFDIATIAASFPETAKTLLVDEYLTNRAEASARVFRVYRPTPPHYHATCDEYLIPLFCQGSRGGRIPESRHRAFERLGEWIFLQTFVLAPSVLS
jgi:hypothetical protein